MPLTISYKNNLLKYAIICQLPNWWNPQPSLILIESVVVKNTNALIPFKSQNSKSQNIYFADLDLGIMLFYLVKKLI